MSYLLDSNTVSDLYNRTSPQHELVRKRLSALMDKDNVYISVLSLYEMEYGYANAPSDKKLTIRRQIEAMCDDLELLPLSQEATISFGTLKKTVQDARMLSAKNIKQHSVDVMIATNAILLNAIVVSDDKLFMELAEIVTFVVGKTKRRFVHPTRLLFLSILLDHE